MNQLYRPEAIEMKIHTGILESLGINMYTSIGKSLVEFVANAFDADATRVDIKIPFDEIKSFDSSVKQNSNDNDSLFMNPTIEITITDNGHGMTVKEIEDKFLPISRNRKKEQGNKSESRKRTVMGRKGLGKLAGFGAAKKMSVWSTRKGEAYATEIIMDYEEIDKQTKMHGVKIPAEYHPCPKDQQETTISLSVLRIASVKSSKEAIKSTIAKNFFISGEDFKIYLNGELVEEEKAEYEFCYPENDPVNNSDKLTEIHVPVDENFEYPILCTVKFRARKEGKRTSLPAEMRGARIYCNQRLAAGPTLLDLETGMHNFHSQSYMECIVHADVLDQSEIDLITTNRSDIKTDDPIVESLRKAVTSLMKDALREHSKFREIQIDEQLKSDPISNMVLNSISGLSTKHRDPAKKVLKTLALSSEGIGTRIFEEIAPLFVKAINSSEVLVELIKTETDPKDIITIMRQLSDLSDIENSDIIKLYKGRRSAILGLEKLQEKMHGKHPKEENQLHQLLKNNPWLIKPEYDRFLTSDRTLSTVAKELTSILEIDTKAPEHMKNDRKRPDLVFVATDLSEKSHICVIELKAPNKPLEDEDLSQLERYMALVGEWLTNNNIKSCKVTGCLIGNLEPKDTNLLLRKRINDAGPETDWEVITIPDLLIRAKQVHHAGIEVLEAIEEESDN